MVSGYVLGLADGQDKLKSKENDIKWIGSIVYLFSVYSVCFLPCFRKNTFFLQLIHDF